MPQRDVYLVGFKKPIWKHLPYDYVIEEFASKKEANVERTRLQNHGLIKVIIKKRNKNDK